VDVSLANQLVRGLERAGIRVVFGLPGTQNVDLYESLRGSHLRTVVATHELSASFMANGYYRVSGRPAVLATIPGPGFTYALTGMAEARLDSAAVLHLTAVAGRADWHAFQSQDIDQETVAGPLAKRVLRAGAAGDLAALAERAVGIATAGEPGPVLLQLDREAGVATDWNDGEEEVGGGVLAGEEDIDLAVSLVASAQRIVVLTGQGAASAPDALERLVERTGAVVISTTSGRGALPEDHPRSLGFEMAGFNAGPMNELIAASDLVLALGCKFSQNGSRGYRLHIEPEKLIHVDTSRDVLGANYPARLTVLADVGAFLGQLGERIVDREGWPAADVASWRQRGRQASWDSMAGLTIAGRRPMADLFAAMERVLPRDTVVVTDSGRHQFLVRRHWRVRSPRGLIMPTNLQSMGFGIPAAMGAKLASPERPVFAVIGDGGLLMSGLELINALAEGIDVRVIVLRDEEYGLIKEAQGSHFGATHATDLPHLDYEQFTGALGVSYFRIGGEADGTLEKALLHPGPSLIEIPCRETTPAIVKRAKGLVKRGILNRLRR